ncbi:MAG: DNA/RNA non-specific endonuclease [Paludibacteraceae bacterium]|nr:DNA/RNA non-specific endonuclease [Paludibacteraceae bacterium]
MKKLSYLLLAIATMVLYSCEATDPWSGNTTSTLAFLPELPETINNSNYIYVTHKATLNNREVRNYSMCFDKSKYAALWVAYPLHSCYMGGSGRTDNWAYDPSIVSSYQVSTGGYSTWDYTRGHQIPSADRTANASVNAQTFYMSNMTPQGYDFNSGIWASLENRVRTYVCRDTLYVVTGAHWGDGYDYVKKYPKPTHYYKVLLRTKKGNSGKNVADATRDELKCIGFWLDHETTGALNSSYCKSVAEIERLTGFTFFPKVDVDKTQFNPSEWGYSN